MNVTRDNLVVWIVNYEQGDLTESEVIALFQFLLDSGLVWQLQGQYGRTASRLLQAGLITRNGENDEHD